MTPLTFKLRTTCTTMEMGLNHSSNAKPPAAPHLERVSSVISVPIPTGENRKEVGGKERGEGAGGGREGRETLSLMLRVP